MLLLAYTLQLNIPGKFQKNIVGHFWVIQDYKALFLVPLLFQMFWVLLCLEIWEVQPQQPSLQKEGTEPPMPCEGIISSSRRDTERLLVSMKAAEREENVGCSLEILPVLWVKEVKKYHWTIPHARRWRKGLGNVRARWAWLPNATEGSCSFHLHHLSDRLAEIARTIYS